MLKNLFFLLIAPFIFFLDRICKILVVRAFSEGEGFPVLPPVFYITRVNNTGAAFGMLKGRSGVLIVVSLLCVGALVFYLSKNLFSRVSWPIRSAWLFILAGALGNLYDRLRYGYVVDYLDFRIWPVFNIADASICVGAFLIIFSYFKYTKTASG